MKKKMDYFRVAGKKFFTIGKTYDRMHIDRFLGDGVNFACPFKRRFSPSPLWDIRRKILYEVKKHDTGRKAGYNG